MNAAVEKFLASMAEATAKGLVNAIAGDESAALEVARQSLLAAQTQRADAEGETLFKHFRTER